MTASEAAIDPDLIGITFKVAPANGWKRRINLQNATNLVAPARGNRAERGMPHPEPCSRPHKTDPAATSGSPLEGACPMCRVIYRLAR